MNHQELVKEVAQRLMLTQAQVDQVIYRTCQIIKSEMKRGGVVNLRDFGRFKVKNRPARKGRNPQTGAEIQIAASSVPVFSATSAFHRDMNS